MENQHILFIIKFFSEERHAEEFLAGSLYLNRLSYFKTIENRDDVTRRDPNEAAYAWLQPDNLKIEIKNPHFGVVEITNKDLAGPVSISFNQHADMHVYCMYAVHIPAFPENKDGKIELDGEQVAALENSLAVDERCKEFGQYAVIARAEALLSRLQETLQARGQWFHGQLVEYYDDSTFHGNFEPKEAPFRKQRRFEYQQEFRVCIHTNTKGNDPLVLQIGDLSDIAGRLDTENLGNVFRLHLDPL